MAFLLFSNNESTTLALPVGSSDTTATLLSATGLPNPGAGQYFVMSFFDAATKSITEIVWVTNVTGNVITMVRAQEGTTALSWLAGDFISNLWTAGQAASMAQLAQIQAQTQNYAVDSGTANHIIAAYSPVITSHLVGTPLRVKVSHTCTGPTDFNPGPGAVSVTGPDGSALVANDVINNGIYEMIYNGVTYQMNPVIATTTRAGVAPLATNAVAAAGTDPLAIITPATLAYVLSLFPPVPPGTISDFAATTPPSGWLECNGASLATASYPTLFAVIGYVFGGSGANFNIPDLRGYFTRGWDHSAGVDPGRTFGSTQASAFAGHFHLNGVAGAQSQPYVYGTSTSGLPGFASAVFQKENNSVAFQGPTQTVGGTDTRPINVAVLKIIKT